jgi:hypothetical protein
MAINADNTAVRLLCFGYHFCLTEPGRFSGERKRYARAEAVSMTQRSCSPALLRLISEMLVARLIRFGENPADNVAELLVILRVS